MINDFSYESTNSIPAMHGVYLLKTTFEDMDKYKPVLVVSNEKYNKGPYCFICPITIDEKESSPTIFQTLATGRESNVIVSNMRSVDKTRLSEYIGQLTASEIEKCNRCICALFGIVDIPEPVKYDTHADNGEYLEKAPDFLSHRNATPHTVPSDDNKTIIEQQQFEIQRLSVENKLLKEQYDTLLNKYLDR